MFKCAIDIAHRMALEMGYRYYQFLLSHIQARFSQLLQTKDKLRSFIQTSAFVSDDAKIIMMQ